ncbi:probable LRR receptor-like serine/threonine-protein kinase At3g47570 [Salvia hispanica]|uniref:probable LRR receptor-like serine/threonine-protein kinase At3g47570 n=1 Tax=Salvia hispanica TaxID=49212 RepID=UPI00200943FC|nr:probable LRR receptor-like serine/threonine-protein kinase At3g47570 [Salvia hispanica]
MIPRFLVELRLLYLNLSFNEMQGEVPSIGVFQNESAISLQGNLDLCGGVETLHLPSCPSSQKSKKKGLDKILIPTIVGAICLALAVCLCLIIIYKRRTLQNIGTPIFQLPDILRLSYGDLLNATNGFSETNLVGAGRFGYVYKGTINEDDEQTDLAVKVLNLNTRGACKSLASECNALRGIRHRNLLKIVSVCDSTDFQGNDFKALVYEFVANGSLEKWLHSDNEGMGTLPLSAIQRLNIAIDIASAVEYLHCGTESIVIHGDLKPSNILLDQDMVAKVGDFGLAKIVSSISQSLPSTEGSSSSAIKGTIGYIAPEYGMSYVASTQGDVYSYGVLVLELFTNKRPTSDAFEGCLNLQDFVSTALTDCVMEVVDPFLHQELNVAEKYWDCIVSILRIGVRCSKQLPRDRMSMAEVVNDLKKIRNVLPKMLDDHGEWKWGAFRHFISSEAAAVIAGIRPPYEEVGADLCIWRWEKNGKLSVASAYESKMLDDHGEWKWGAFRHFISSEAAAVIAGIRPPYEEAGADLCIWRWEKEWQAISG